MSILIDVLIIAFIVLGVLAGIKKGLIKSAIGFVGLVAIIIIAYIAKDKLAYFLIDKLPFIPFSGSFQGISSLNILLYNAVSFLIIFVVLYCALNIVISVTGFIDTLLKLTVIWIIPSKIGGGIVGFITSWVYVYLILLVLSSFTFSSGIINDTKLGTFVLDHTPIVGNILYGTKEGAREVFTTIDEITSSGEEYKKEELNTKVLQLEIQYGLISKDKAQELLDTRKINIKGLYFGENDLWLNI